MREELLARLRRITAEERAILDGERGIRREIYTSQEDFVVDSQKLLEAGKLIQIRPHTRFAYFPSHRHNYVELVYMCSGSTTHIIDGAERVVLEEGDLLFLGQSVRHEILPAGEDDIAVNFIILPAFFHRPISMIERENVLRDFLISTLAEGTSLARYLHIRAKGAVPVEDLMETMIWSLIEGPGGMNAIHQTTMGLLLMNLSLFAETINAASPGQREQNLVFSVLKYIETNYRDGTLAEISEQLHEPEYTVSRLLKRHTGEHFKGLLQRRKLQQAAYLLANTSLPVEAILDRVGYDNSSYFYRRFRERYGRSPRAFRLENRLP